MILDNRSYTEMSPTPLGRIKIGSRSEIRGTVFERIEYLNENRGHYDVVKRNLYYGIKKLIFGLDLSIQLLPRIFYNAKIFYNKVSFDTKNRSIRLLVPVVVYITCLQEFIFVRTKQLYDLSGVNRKEFCQCLKEIFSLCPDVYKKLINKKFRVKTVLSQLMGLNLYFRFPDQFVFVSSCLLEEYYNDLKNTKIPVITAKIFKLTKDCLEVEMKGFNISDVCYYLGVQRSVLYGELMP